MAIWGLRVADCAIRRTSRHRRGFPYRRRGKVDFGNSKSGSTVNRRQRAFHRLPVALQKPDLEKLLLPGGGELPVWSISCRPTRLRERPLYARKLPLSACEVEGQNWVGYGRPYRAAVGQLLTVSSVGSEAIERHDKFDSSRVIDTAMMVCERSREPLSYSGSGDGESALDSVKRFSTSSGITRKPKSFGQILRPPRLQDALDTRAQNRIGNDKACRLMDGRLQTFFVYLI